MTNIRTTQKTVDEYLKKHSPHMATYEDLATGNKGYYQRNTGPAMSFKACSRTWSGVLKVLRWECEQK